MWTYNHTDELYHHGIKGMKWGRRRWQTKDGSLTPAGRQRYSDVDAKRAAMKTAKKEYNKSFNKAYNRSIAAYSPIKKHREANDARWVDAANKAKVYDKAKKEYKEAKKQEKANRTPEEKAARRKKALKVGAAVVGTALAAYGAKKLSDAAKDKAFKVAWDRGNKATDKFMMKWNAENVYPALRGDKQNLTKILDMSENLNTHLGNKDIDYAKRHSKNTVAAVKTLMGKNYELTLSELLNSGIDVFDPELDRILRR